jgi:hypothetical protein
MTQRAMIHVTVESKKKRKKREEEENKKLWMRDPIYHMAGMYFCNIAVADIIICI